MSQNKTAQGRWHPRLRHRKSKGEWAEIAFMSRAIGLGFTVCRPFGENHRFDFLVFAAGGKVSRVQVKSSWTKRQNVYQFKTSGSGRPYRRGEVDFIVVLVVPEEVWYIVPIREVLGRDAAAVFPHVRKSRGRLEKYRQAWYLLRTPEPVIKLPQTDATGPDLLPFPALLDFCNLTSSI
ncbi:MAG: hypothetical protein LAN37_14300 [Acidobacteriia bacterium]|nr:hypothetical protein [Terriglobia bacterium]